MIVYLIGPRASGKTSVGARVAEALGLEFVDTDAWMLAETGEPVARVVAEFGWEEFRRRETDALKRLTRPERVIATGGGMVLARENRDFMRKNGVVLYLAAPAAVLAARLSRNPDAGLRPSLTGRKSAVEELSEVLAEREPLYRAAAHHVVDASPGIGEVAAEAARRISP